MPSFLFVLKNCPEHITVSLLKYLEFIVPNAPLCCILFPKPAEKKTEDLNENR